MYNKHRRYYGRRLAQEIGLEGFWDDVYKVVDTVGKAAPVVGGIIGGQSAITVVPTALPGTAPRPGAPRFLDYSPANIASSIPGWVWPVAIGGLVLLIARRR